MRSRLFTTILVCAFAFCMSAQTATRHVHSDFNRRSDVRSDDGSNVIQRNVVEWRDGQHTATQYSHVQHRDTWHGDARPGARPFTRYSVGLNLGTYGGGLWVATNLSNHFALRAGFNYLGFTFPTELETSMAAYNRNTGVQLPNEVDVNFGRPEWRMPHGSLKIGWTPVANGIFSLQIGAYVGNFDFVVDGQVDHSQPGTLSFAMAGARLDPRDDGTFDGRLRMGNLVKPYFGIGIGRTIPRSRVGFKFDLGVAYQGPLRFISDQATLSNVNDDIHSEHIPDGLELMKTIADLARFWPVMNFSLTYRF